MKKLVFFSHVIPFCFCVSLIFPVGISQSPVDSGERNTVLREKNKHCDSDLLS